MIFNQIQFVQDDVSAIYYKLMKKDKNKEEGKDYCVQCIGPFEAMTADGNYSVCIRAECPNFGLLQLGVEKVSEFLKFKAK